MIEHADDNAQGPNTIKKKSVRIIEEVECYELTEDELDLLEDAIRDSGIALAFSATFFGATISLLGGLLTVSFTDRFQIWIVFFVLFAGSLIATIWFSIVAYRRKHRFDKVLSRIRDGN